MSAAYQILKNAQVGAVILGAGFGRRFGSDKRVAALGNTTVAAQTVRHYCEVFARLKVVLKTEDTALAELLGQHAEIIFTDQSHLGMGHSLAAGFANLDWQWAFVGLLDMPFLRPASLEKVALTALNTQQKSIRPVFTPQQTNQDATTLQGHPIGLHSSLFAQVRQSSGDKGARWLLQENQSAITDVSIDDPGIIMDVDQPKDLLQQS